MDPSHYNLNAETNLLIFIANIMWAFNIPDLGGLVPIGSLALAYLLNKEKADNAARKTWSQIKAMFRKSQ